MKARSLLNGVRFENCADDYMRFRPDDPAALYNTLTERARTTIVDAEARTGKGGGVIDLEYTTEMWLARPMHTATGIPR
jgi:hypothetical protein